MKNKQDIKIREMKYENFRKQKFWEIRAFFNFHIVWKCLQNVLFLKSLHFLHWKKSGKIEEKIKRKNIMIFFLVFFYCEFGWKYLAPLATFFREMRLFG